MTDFKLESLTRSQLRAALADAACKLRYVKETVRDYPEEHIPFPRLREISFLDQRVREYKAELTRRFSDSAPAHVFYSYSRHDEPFMAELDEQLSSMRSEGRIKTFWDRNMGAGREWHSETTEELRDADVVLFLVSDHFLNSRYCQQVELPAAIEMHNEGLVRAVPIVLGRCEWQGTPLGRLQGIPRVRPITEWMDRSEGWAEVVQGLKSAIAEMRQN